MRKNSIIGILTVLLILSIVYSVCQKYRADKFEKELTAQLVMFNAFKKHSQEVYEKAKLKAEKLEEEAIKQKVIAESQVKLALEEAKRAKDRQEVVDKMKKVTQK